MTMLSELASEVSMMVEDVVDEVEEVVEILDCPQENMEVVELVLRDLVDMRERTDNLFHFLGDLGSGHPEVGDCRIHQKLYCHFQGILTLFHCTCLQLTPGLQSLQQEEIKQEI